LAQEVDAGFCSIAEDVVITVIAVATLHACAIAAGGFFATDRSGRRASPRRASTNSLGVALVVSCTEKAVTTGIALSDGVAASSIGIANIIGAHVVVGRTTSFWCGRTIDARTRIALHASQSLNANLAGTGPYGGALAHAIQARVIDGTIQAVITETSIVRVFAEPAGAVIRRAGVVVVAIRGRRTRTTRITIPTGRPGSTLILATQLVEFANASAG